MRPFVSFDGMTYILMAVDYVIKLGGSNCGS